MKRPLALLLCLALTGCVSSPRDTGVRVWNPLTWFSRSEANASDRAEAKADAARADVDDAQLALLKAAQQNAHETALALISAPASRAVEVASESANQTTDNLDQALGSLPAETLTSIRTQVSSLLSDNATLRAEGERLRATQREDAAAASRDLAAATKRADAADAVADAARADLRSAFDRENALANELRNERFLRHLATVAAVAAALFGWAMRRNFLGLATSAGEIVGTMRAKYGVKDEDVMTITGLIDSPTTPSTQARIASIAARVAGEILATKPTSSTS